MRLIRKTSLIKVLVILFTIWLTFLLLVYIDSKSNPLKDNLSVFNLAPLVAPQVAISNRRNRGSSLANHRLDSDDWRNKAVLAAPKISYGDMGKPVVLPTNLSIDIKALVDDGWEKNAFNQYVSDLISINRSLPDPRDNWQVVFFSKKMNFQK